MRPEHGFGMDGLLRWRAEAVSGILNGVDTSEWSPRLDTRIAAHFSVDHPEGKTRCKLALREEVGLQPDASTPLFCVVSRLSEQKGLDLLLAALPRLLAGGGQLVLLGSGDTNLEEGYQRAADENPGRVAVRLGYDEDLAHRIVAGSDVIVVPSRYEPCGLTQMYGLAYGTLPLVRNVGGLADTVHDATGDNLAAGTATGFVFDEASAAGLESGIARVFALWNYPPTWRQLSRTAMLEDHGWLASARRYRDLYAELRPDA
jgi:starch synthase